MLPLLFCLGLAFPNTPSDSIQVNGTVSDSFTREGIVGATITFIRPNGTKVGKSETVKKFIKWEGSTGRGFPDGYYEVKVPQPGTYIVQMTVKDHQTLTDTLVVPAKRYLRKVREWTSDYLLPRLPLKRDIKLGDAVVKATKIKMVMKGDTIVYNADAFQLSEGSMLDQLINHLPGMKVDANGNITRNGEHVEELLVNGKDFFKGNPKIALDNLPAYIVDKVKVYRRAPKDAYLSKSSENIEPDKKLVVDVNLKHQYCQGWISNAEAAGGTNDRFLARIFALRYTDHSKLFAYGSIDNLNNGEQPGSDGNWTSKYMYIDRRRTSRGGINLNIDDKETKSEYNTSLTACHYNRNDEHKTSSVNYLETGDTYTRSDYWENGHDTKVTWKNSAMLPLKDFFFYFTPEASYSYNKSRGLSRSAQFNENPVQTGNDFTLDSIYSPVGSQRYRQMLVNSMLNITNSLKKTWQLNGTTHINLLEHLFGNNLIIQLNGSYEHTDNTLFSSYNLLQPQIDQTDYRNQYSLQPAMNYNYKAVAAYKWTFSRFEKLEFQLSHTYNQKFRRGHRDLFRLDRLENGQEENGQTASSLPSASDSLQSVMDWKNSFHTTELHKIHTTTLELRTNIKNIGVITLNLPLSVGRYAVHDTRNRQNNFASRQLTTLTPSFDLSQMTVKEKETTYYRVGYRYTQELPKLFQLIDYEDDSDPLVVQKGNPGLHNTSTHVVSSSLSRNFQKRQRSIHIFGEWRVIRHAVAQSMQYDRLTGLSTYSPRNIDGNWNSSLGGHYSQTLDSLDRLSLKANTTVRYANNADYISEKNGQATHPYRSSVRNAEWNTDLNIKYQYKKHHIGLTGRFEWDHLSSCLGNFTNVNALGYSYGVKAKIALPWNITFNTDLTMFSRRGYNDNSLNDDHLIWNAELTRSFLKGNRLLLKLEGFDLLNQLSNVYTNVNAQGRTETWYNTIPRYMMLHAVYKLNILPKNKK